MRCSRIRFGRAHCANTLRPGDNIFELGRYCPRELFAAVAKFRIGWPFQPAAALLRRNLVPGCMHLLRRRSPLLGQISQDHRSTEQGGHHRRHEGCDPKVARECGMAPGHDGHRAEFYQKVKITCGGIRSIATVEDPATVGDGGPSFAVSTLSAAAGPLFSRLSWHATMQSRAL
jgi:hypothetical protein